MLAIKLVARSLLIFLGQLAHQSQSPNRGPRAGLQSQYSVPVPCCVPCSRRCGSSRGRRRRAGQSPGKFYIQQACDFLFQIIAAQEEMLKKERELEEARKKLAQIRQQQYKFLPTELREDEG